MKAWGKTLEPVAATASAAGKAEVVAYIRLLAKVQMGQSQDFPAVTKSLAKVKPLMQKDCGFTAPK